MLDAVVQEPPPFHLTGVVPNYTGLPIRRTIRGRLRDDWRRQFASTGRVYYDLIDAWDEPLGYTKFGR